jgi:uncharacterized membrane protein YbhN (UPF0104 family)
MDRRDPVTAAADVAILKALRTIALQALALAITIFAGWIIVRGLDFGALVSALRSTKRLPLLLTSTFAVSHLCLRGIGWHVMLGPVPGGSALRMVRYTIASAAASLLAPFRTAEVLRPWLLRRNHGVPLSQSAGVILADKLVEAVGLALLASSLPLLGRRIPLSGGQAAVISALLAAAVSAGILGAGRVFVRISAFTPFLRGIRTFSEPRRFALALAVSVLAWLFDIAAIATTLAAFHIHLPVADLILLLLFINVALLLPSAPGNIGTLELGATLGATYLGIPHTQAVAFALVYHAAQLAPLILLGLFGLVEAVTGRTRPKPAPAETLTSVGR